MLYFVYDLIDPRTEKPRYVGITSNPNARLKRHLEDVDTNPAKFAWISELATEGFEPRLHILEIVDSLKLAREREKYWVDHYLSSSEQLLNIQLAGDGREIEALTYELPIFSSRAERVFSEQPGYVSAEEAARMLGVDIGVFHRAIKTLLLDIRLYSLDPFLRMP